jgi:hypothetical protein
MMSILKKHENPQIDELVKTTKTRTKALSNIKSRKDDNYRKICVWCNETLKGKKRKWCSEECSSSAWAFFNPQSVGGLHIILSMQDYKCNGCKHDYMPDIKKAQAMAVSKDIPQELDKNPNWYVFYTMKGYNYRSNTSPEIDHIKPIAMGGESIGFGNHQVLCKRCHKIKTKIDMKNIASYKRSKK